MTKTSFKGIVARAPRNGQSSKGLQLITVLTEMDGKKMAVDVSAFGSAAVAEGNIVRVVTNKIDQVAWEKDGKSGVNHRCTTNGKGLMVLAAINALQPRQRAA